MSPQHAEENCTNCGERNLTTVRICKMCSSPLPWVAAQRAAEAAQVQQKAKAVQQRKANRRQALAPANQAKKVSGKALPVATKVVHNLPAYKGSGEPMISIGNVEAPTAQIAAIASILFLLLSVFAPLITLLIVSVNLMTSRPSLGFANLLAAAIIGSVLWNKQYRLCYLAALISTIALLVVAYPLFTADRSLVNPLQLLSWGVVPLVLAPITCAVAGYFGGVPQEPEDEEVVSANPFGHSKDVLFQTRITARIKEASGTAAFQRAMSSNPQRIKDQLQLTKSATSWSEVPDDIKHLLEDAELEVRHQIGGDDEDADAVVVEEPSGSSRAIINGVAVGVLLLFGGLFFMFRTPAKPIERDLGTLDQTNRSAKVLYRVLQETLPDVIEITEDNPNVPEIVITIGEREKTRNSDGLWTYNVIYVPKSEKLYLKWSLNANGKLAEREVDLGVTPKERLPKLLSEAENEVAIAKLADEATKARKKFERSTRELDRKFDELGRSFR